MDPARVLFYKHHLHRSVKGNNYSGRAEEPPGSGDDGGGKAKEDRIGWNRTGQDRAGRAGVPNHY